MKKKFGFWFGFHTQNCMILGLVLGFHTQFLGVLGMILGVGMKPIPKTQTQIFFWVPFSHRF